MDAPRRRSAEMAPPASGVGAALIGTPETIAQRIRTYESLGVSLFMLHFYPMREGMEQFAQRVLPLVR